MCGRAACGLSPNALQRVAGVKRFHNSDRYFASYNICPGNFIPVLLQQQALNYYNSRNISNNNNNNNNNEQKDNCDSDEETLIAMKWGLIPSFSRDIKNSGSSYKTINARIEGISKSPLYRRLINNRRCIVLFEGYYEWKNMKDKNIKKQPFIFHFGKSLNERKEKRDENDDCTLLYALAVYDKWENKETNESLFSVSILTCDANKYVSSVHHRMPIIFDINKNKNLIKKWLDTKNVELTEEFKKEIVNKVTIDSNINSYKVPPQFVGSVKNKSKECVQPFEAYKKKTGLTKFFKFEKKQTKDKKIENQKVIEGQTKSKFSGGIEKNKNRKSPNVSTSKKVKNIL